MQVTVARATGKGPPPGGPDGLREWHEQTPTQGPSALPARNDVPLTDLGAPRSKRLRVAYPIGWQGEGAHRDPVLRCGTEVTVSR